MNPSGSQQQRAYHQPQQQLPPPFFPDSNNYTLPPTWNDFSYSSSSNRGYPGPPQMNRGSYLAPQPHYYDANRGTTMGDFMPNNYMAPPAIDYAHRHYAAMDRRDFFSLPQEVQESMVVKSQQPRLGTGHSVYAQQSWVPSLSSQFPPIHNSLGRPVVSGFESRYSPPGDYQIEAGARDHYSAHRLNHSSPAPLQQDYQSQLSMHRYPSQSSISSATVSNLEDSPSEFDDESPSIVGACSRKRKELPAPQQHDGLPRFPKRQRIADVLADHDYPRGSSTALPSIVEMTGFTLREGEMSREFESMMQRGIEERQEERLNDLSRTVNHLKSLRSQRREQEQLRRFDYSSPELPARQMTYEGFQNPEASQRAAQDRSVFSGSPLPPMRNLRNQVPFYQNRNMNRLPENEPALRAQRRFSEVLVGQKSRRCPTESYVPPAGYVNRSCVDARRRSRFGLETTVDSEDDDSEYGNEEEYGDENEYYEDTEEAYPDGGSEDEYYQGMAEDYPKESIEEVEEPHQGHQDDIPDSPPWAWGHGRSQIFTPTPAPLTEAEELAQEFEEQSLPAEVERDIAERRQRAGSDASSSLDSREEGEPLEDDEVLSGEDRHESTDDEDEELEFEITMKIKIRVKIDDIRQVRRARDTSPERTETIERSPSYAPASPSLQPPQEGEYSPAPPPDWRFLQPRSPSYAATRFEGDDHLFAQHDIEEEEEEEEAPRYVDGKALYPFWDEDEEGRRVEVWRAFSSRSTSIATDEDW